jgi:hypothetical protein
VSEFNYYYYRYSALGPVRAETRAQSGDWYGSGMLHRGQILRGSLPLLFPPEFNMPTFRNTVPSSKEGKNDESSYLPAYDGGTESSET